MRRFTAGLDTLLTDHNEEHSEQTRIRLRVSMHLGTMTTAGPLGSGSQALIDVSRLLDCQPVRDALKQARTANLALIVSQTFFDQVIVTQLAGLRPDQFSKVLVDLPAKKFRQNAYLYIPDELTTRILLTAAGRVIEGWLRSSDADHLDDLLFTGIDAIWAACSRGRWGFAAQRSVPSAGRPARYQALSREFGWRPGGDLPPVHAELTASPRTTFPSFRR